MNIVVLIFVMFLLDGTPAAGIRELPEGSMCSDELALAVINAEASRRMVEINQNYWLWDCKDVESPGPQPSPVKFPSENA